MANSERPQYLPPLHLRPDAGERDGEFGPVPLPRTANSVHSGGTGLSRSTSGASRARSGHTTTGSHAPRSPSSYSTTFTIPSSTGAHSTSPPPGSTHAGGILPSASFFHPSRPTYYTDFGPLSNFKNALDNVNISTVPRSTGAIDPTAPRPESTGSDSFAQASFISDEPAPNVVGRDRSGSTSQGAVTLGVGLNRGFSTKKSREPLLPIGQKPKPIGPTRPPVSTNSTNKLPGIGGYSKWGDGVSTKGEEAGTSGSIGTGGRVRTSLERFLRRTLSNDTQMAEDTSFARGSTLPASMEDFELRGRNSEEPYIEFKANSGPLTDEEGTMNITRSYNTTAPSTISRRQHNPAYQSGYPDFNPVPPSTDPPLARTPIVDSNGKPIRKFKLHPSRNVFFLKGRLLTGGDSYWPFICSLVLVFGLTGTWLGTTAVWWWKNESPAVTIIGAYMCLITIANMMAAVTKHISALAYQYAYRNSPQAFSDPGILPRNLDPDPPYPQSLSLSQEDVARVPLPRDLKVRSGV